MRRVLFFLALVIILTLTFWWVKATYFTSAFHRLSQRGDAERNSEFNFGGQGESPKAVNFYTKALEAWQPADGIAEKTEVLKHRAELLLLTTGHYGNKAKEAVADYTAILEIDPKNYDIYAKRAGWREFLKLYDQAIADYNAALDLVDVPDARQDSSYEKDALYYGRGLCYFQKKNYKDAISDFTAALKADRSTEETNIAPPSVDYYINRVRKPVKVSPKIGVILPPCQGEV